MSDCVTISDVRRAGYCPAGARAWFNGRGFDFRDFLKNGISADVLLATGDPMAVKVVEVMRSHRG